MSAPLFDTQITEESAPEVPEVKIPERKKRNPKPVKRTRPKPQSPSISGREQEIVNRVIRFFEDDQRARRDDMQARIQRHAKMRMWIDEGYDGPWADSSNVALGDIMAVVLRTEDTMQNAVLSTRPIVTSKATHGADKEGERKIDLLHDHQFFNEQDGEKLVEMCSCDFVRDGSFKLYTRWVTEHRRVVQTRYFNALPALEEPRTFFMNLIKSGIENVQEWREMPGSDGWDWWVWQGKQKLEVRFYTDEDNDDETIMEISGDVLAFDGPCTVRYSYENVLYPYFCENLQSPGPSNPKGASHVILVDYPTIDEVKRLVREGEYNLLSEEDVEGLQPQSTPEMRDYDVSLEAARDQMRGFDTDTNWNSSLARSHGTVCRLTCFDLWEPGDGKDSIDVVWTVLKGPKLLARAKHLGEICPGNPPMRPVSSAAMIPIPGRVDGIGIPELMERGYDFKKTTFDMMVDGAHIEMIPGFTYRQSSMVNPEEYKMMPGWGMPVGQQGDIQPFQIRPQSVQTGINIVSLIDQMQDDLTMVGDLQLGRIPAGKSSALRTSGGIQQVLAQGEARPERILRRFFSGFKTVFRYMYELNRNYLSDEKNFRVMGLSGVSDDRVSISRKVDLSSDMAFEFEANILNSSKVAMQQAMETILTLTLNPLAFQLGVADGETIYRVFSEYMRAQGQNPEKYLKRPTPDSSKPKVLAQEALFWIARGETPVGVPAEGSYAEHLQSLSELLNKPSQSGGVVADLLSDEERSLLREYIAKTREMAIQEQQAQQQQAAAAELRTQLTQQGGRGGTGAQGGQTGTPIVEGGDVIDESLPASGTPQ